MIWLGCVEEQHDADTECLLGSIAVEGDAIPGEVLTLRAENAERWILPDGSEVRSEEVEWMVPEELAVDGPEILSITAEGCDESITASVEVDYPEDWRTVVVYDPASSDSEKVARAYQAFRDVPAENMCPVSTTTSVEIGAEEFASFVDLVLACTSPWTHVIVPVYGVPYRVSGQVTDFYSGALVAVSLDALLFFGAAAPEQDSWTRNPIYQEGDSSTQTYDPWVPFGELREAEFLVTRIEGESADAAIELIERTEAAQGRADAGTLTGTVYVDGNRGDTPPTSDAFGSYESGEWNMWGTRYLFEADGRWPVVWDGNEAEFGTEPAPTDCPDALFYAGWYSYGNYNDCFSWNTGAIGAHLDSYSAGTPRGEGSWSGGALLDGITATFGAVNEPYVAGMPEYDQFFLYLLQGASYAEAAYQSTQEGAWMMLYVGDPWYRPFPKE